MPAGKEEYCSILCFVYSINIKFQSLIYSKCALEWGGGIQMKYSSGHVSIYCVAGGNKTD